MAVVALYFVLNLFSGNIQTIVKNSGIYRALYKNNADAKTAYVKDPNPIKTQINVQIVGDQGSLAEYHRDAAATIERYETESHTETLTDENIQNLALQMTIFAESGPNSPGVSPQSMMYNAHFAQNPALSYFIFGSQNGIIVNDDAYGILSNTKITRNGRDIYVYWGAKPKHNGNPYNASASSNYTSQRSDTDRVKNINGIEACFNDQYKI